MTKGRRRKRKKKGTRKRKRRKLSKNHEVLWRRLKEYLEINRINLELDLIKVDQVGLAI